MGNLLFDTAGSGLGEFPATTLGPGDAASGLVFQNGELNLDRVIQLLRDSSGLIVEVVSNQVTDRNDQSFVHSATSIRANTATILIDYGVDVPPEQYQVATNVVPRNPGITASKALQGHLRIVKGEEYETGTVPWDHDGDGVAESTIGPGLTRIRSFASNTATNSYWVVAHTRDAGLAQETTIYNPLDEPYDFDSIELRAGDVLHLTLIRDSDRDGLGNRAEFRYGTDPSLEDTDGDGLTDGEEIRGWDIQINNSQVRVHSNPLIPDSDGDGRSDLVEFQQGSHPGLRPEPIVVDVGATSDGLTVTLSAFVEDPDGVVKQVAVEWGDGSPEERRAGDDLVQVSGLSHTYSQAGIYNVAVSAIDDAGNRSRNPWMIEVVVPAGLLAYYPLDGNVRDAGPLGLDARYYLDVNGYAPDRFGMPDKAVGLIGTPVSESVRNGFVFAYSTIIAPHMDFSGNFTIGAWFLHHNPRGNSSRIVGQGDWFNLYIDGEHVVFGPLDERMPVEPAVRDPEPLRGSTWVSYVGTVTVVDGDSVIRLYRNGVEVAERRVENTVFENPGECNFYIGPGLADIRREPLAFIDQQMNTAPAEAGSECNTPFAIVLFPGHIDDVRVYNLALEPGRIQELYGQ